MKNATQKLSPADESLLRALSAPREEIRWSETLDAETKARCEAFVARGLAKLDAGKYVAVVS